MNSDCMDGGCFLSRDSFPIISFNQLNRAARFYNTSLSSAYLPSLLNRIASSCFSSLFKSSTHPPRLWPCLHIEETLHSLAPLQPAGSNCTHALPAHLGEARGLSLCLLQLFLCHLYVHCSHRLLFTPATTPSLSCILLVFPLQLSSVQFSSVAQSCPTLCDPMSCSTPGLPVHHQLPESTETHVH